MGRLKWNPMFCHVFFCKMIVFRKVPYLLYCTCQAKCIFADPLQISQVCHRFENATKPSRFPHSWQSAESLAPATQNDASTSNGANMWCFFNLLTLKCASRHYAVHFFDISASKIGPRSSCFFSSLRWLFPPLLFHLAILSKV